MPPNSRRKPHRKLPEVVAGDGAAVQEFWRCIVAVLELAHSRIESGNVSKVGSLVAVSQPALQQRYCWLSVEASATDCEMRSSSSGRKTESWQMRQLQRLRRAAST